MWRRLTGAVVVANLAACATPQGEALIPRLKPIELALTQDLATLESRAGKGVAQDQLALALIYAHGLKGKRADREVAASWTARAVAQRGSTPLTMYTPAYDGKPSRVSLIFVPRYTLREFDVAVVERCVRALETSDPSTAAAMACGGPAEHDELRRLWTTAGHNSH